jgi:ABC-2 type transport system ATP-binding protein
LNLLLTVEGISKRFGSNPVLRDVSFSVLDGEVLGLIGPNGAGKTTLFECLAGLMHADAGDVKLRDHSIPAPHRKEALFYMPDAILASSGNCLAALKMKSQTSRGLSALKR